MIAKYNGDSEERTVLRMLQLTELEILKEVVRVCDANSLQYFLIGGTLLGAIRHKGFIPWDDDIDIALPRKDYERLLDLCVGQLDSRYYLHCSNTDAACWMPYAKVRKHNTLFDEVGIAHVDVPKGIFIDVFPLDSADRQTSLFQTVQARAVACLKSLILYRTGLFSTANAGWKKLLAISASSVFSVHALSRLQQRVMSWNRNDHAPYYVSLGSHHDSLRQGIRKELYLPAAKVEFEGELFSVPRDWDYVLRRMFGDYMTVLPEQERHVHEHVKVIFDTEREEET